MNMVKLQPFDTARHLDNPEVISHYLAEAFQTRDSKLILRAIRNVVRALAHAQTSLMEREEDHGQAVAGRDMSGTTLVSWDYVRKYEDMCRQLMEAAAFLDGLADTFDSWSVFAGPAYDCRVMAAKLRGEK
jgi:hypothetical protein